MEDLAKLEKTRFEGVKIIVPKVIEATDAVSLAMQVGTYRLANIGLLPDKPVTYLIHPDGGFIAIIEIYEEALKIFKGEL